MISLKWKFYRALNYLLFCCGVIFFLHFLRLLVNNTVLSFLPLSILFSLLFLFMASHSLINIVIMSKTFPDKILSPNKTRWHIFSLILNFISLISLIISFFILATTLSYLLKPLPSNPYRLLAYGVSTYLIIALLM